MPRLSGKIRYVFISVIFYEMGNYRPDTFVVIGRYRREISALLVYRDDRAYASFMHDSLYIVRQTRSLHSVKHKYNTVKTLIRNEREHRCVADFPRRAALILLKHCENANIAVIFKGLLLEAGNKLSLIVFISLTDKKRDFFCVYPSEYVSVPLIHVRHVTVCPITRQLPQFDF